MHWVAVANMFAMTTLSHTNKSLLFKKDWDSENFIIPHRGKKKIIQLQKLCARVKVRGKVDWLLQIRFYLNLGHTFLNLVSYNYDNNIVFTEVEPVSPKPVVNKDRA